MVRKTLTSLTFEWEARREMWGSSSTSCLALG